MKKYFTIQRALIIGASEKERQPLTDSLQHYCPSAQITDLKDTNGAMKTLSEKETDLVFIDSRVLKKDRVFIDAMKENSLNSFTVVMVDRGDGIEAAEAIRNGVTDYLVKSSDCMKALPPILDRIDKSLLVLNKNGDVEESRVLLFRQISRSQKWWQNIIDAITDYLFVLDKEYKILRTNKAFAGLFGKEPADIIMKPYYELYGQQEPHEWSELPEDNSSPEPRSVERQINGSVYLISSFPIFYDEHDAVVYIMKDITETRRLKDQVYHLDKLSSLGTLTSGVAHEINNPLTGIIGYTEMMLMKNENEKSKKYLQNVYDSAIRCKRIVENMLTFSRQTPAHKNLENINDIIDKTIELHEYWLKSTNIEIVREYDQFPFIAVDRQQLQQVFLNLLINAEHAIADTERKGRIEFRTVHESESKRIIIKVTDNGTGIAPEILAKIFDPFYTTKPVNMGTGLGLSIAHGIIAEQSGTIDAESTLGEGTSFTIGLSYSK
jgi:PAS domain S-box-containing protein